MWRRALPADDDAIVEMCLALYREDPSPVPASADKIRRTLAALRAEPARGRAVVFDPDGQCLGYGLLISFWSNEYGGPVCMIDELCVAAPARGRGLATVLIDELAHGSALLPNDAVALALEVTPDNRRARALYERLGFAGRNTVFHRWIKR